VKGLNSSVVVLIVYNIVHQLIGLRPAVSLCKSMLIQINYKLCCFYYADKVVFSGMIAGSILLGKFCDKYGRKIVSCLLMTVSLICHTVSYQSLLLITQSIIFQTIISSRLGRVDVCRVRQGIGP